MAILLVDDDPKVLHSLRQCLVRGTSWSVAEASNASEALALLQGAPFKLVISDVKMPGMDGLALLREAVKLRHPPAVVMLTAYGSVEMAVECLKSGAYDFLIKPVDIDRLIGLVRNVVGRQEAAGTGLCGLIGTSRAMQAVFSQIRSYATTESTVLITGESGTGKELAARAIHTLSPGRSRIVVVNCPAIPEPVLESELFGHARGAFTSAVASRKGLLEEGDGGTLVLDEIGDLPLGLQAKLLRVLEDKQVRPVGSNRARRVNVRCLALTNQDLAAKVQAKEFRADLYHRLNVLRLHMPPLRERPEDIPQLAAHFLALFRSKSGRPNLALSRETLELLACQPWPGNVRELRNVIERSVLRASGRTLGPEHLGLEVAAEGFPEPRVEVVPYHKAKRELVEDFSRAYFASVVEMSQGNVTLAAQRCGLKRQYLQWALQRYGLRSP